MKKILAILLAAMMLLSLAACNNNDDNPSGSGDNPGTSQSGNQGGEDSPGTQGGSNSDSLPAGLEYYVTQYPFLADLVYPDNVRITEFDDSDYADDKVIYFTVESMDNSKLDAYIQKANATNLADDEMAFLLHTEEEPLMIIDYSSLSSGWIDLEVYDYSGVAGSVTVSDATISGYDVPAAALKYVGTLDKAYSDSDKVFFVKAKNVSYGAFDTLIAYYTNNGGTLDSANSTSSEKIYTFSWGTVAATHFGLSGEMSIEITLN